MKKEFLYIGILFVLALALGLTTSLANPPSGVKSFCTTGPCYHVLESCPECSELQDCIYKTDDFSGFGPQCCGTGTFHRCITPL